MDPILIGRMRPWSHRTADGATAATGGTADVAFRIAQPAEGDRRCADRLGRCDPDNVKIYKKIYVYVINYEHVWPRIRKGGGGHCGSPPGTSPISGCGGCGSPPFQARSRYM
jgi:hypothetical protein